MQFDLHSFCRDLARDAADAIVYADNGRIIRILEYLRSPRFGVRRRRSERPICASATGADIIRRRRPVTRAMVPALRKDGTGRMVGIAAIMCDVAKRFEKMKALRAHLRQRRSGA